MLASTLRRKNRESESNKRRQKAAHSAQPTPVFIMRVVNFSIVENTFLSGSFSISTNSLLCCGERDGKNWEGKRDVMMMRENKSWEKSVKITFYVNKTQFLLAKEACEAEFGKELSNLIVYYMRKSSLNVVSVVLRLLRLRNNIASSSSQYRQRCHLSSYLLIWVEFADHWHLLLFCKL